MMRIPHSFPILFLLACAGCMAGQEVTPPGVAFEVRPASPTPGQRVTLVLRNSGAGTLGYNLCTSALTRQAAATWDPVPSDRVCTMELRSLEPGNEDTFDLELPLDLQPGTYRFETRVERFDEGESDELATEPFTL